MLPKVMLAAKSGLVHFEDSPILGRPSLQLYSQGDSMVAAHGLL